MATYVLMHGAYQGGWIWKPAERLKAAWHELDPGHYPMLSQPEGLTRLLLT
jgi:hypothetical protein